MTHLNSVFIKGSICSTLRTIWCVLLGSLVLAPGVIRVTSHPAHLYRAPGQNIQPFTCTGKGSSGNGVCMFALDCNKARGTHLGTCVDRFFFGSCCRLPENVKFETHNRTSTVSNSVLSNEIIPTSYSTVSPPSPAPTRRPIFSPATSTSVNDNSIVRSNSSTATSGSIPTTVRVVLKPTTSTQGSSLHITQTFKPVTVKLPTKPVSLSTSEVTFSDNDVLASTVPTTVPSVSTSTDSNHVPSTSTLSHSVVSMASTALTDEDDDEDFVTSSAVAWSDVSTTVVENVNGSTTKPTLTVPPSSSTTAPSTTITSTVSSTTIEVTTEPEPSTTTEETFDPSKIGEMDYTQACGRQLVRERPTARIVNGHKAEFGEWPWQISLRLWYRTSFRHKCGAALLNENWAVTAAHCVNRVPPEHLLVRIGEYDLSSNNEALSHVERRVQITTIHPDFDSRTFENDLALLRFYEPVTFQENIIPICLPSDDEDFVNKTGFVTGWGRLYVDGPLPNVLQEVQVPVITNLACEQEYRRAGYLENIPNIFICAGYPEGGRDSCEGDSGGPLVIKQDNGRWVLAGIISWGIGCADPHQPGVYTRISQFRDWITRILVF